MMKLSFVLPSYNVGLYIIKCINSIVDLKFDKFEIIVVNDCSKDDTKCIVEQYITTNPDVDIKLINRDNSSGSAGIPRNLGLEHATGKYVTFMDPDDFYLGNGLKDVFIDNNQDIQMYSFVSVNEKNELKDVYNLKTKKLNKSKDRWSQILNVCIQRCIFKREFLINNKLEFVPHIRGQDLIFLYDAFNKTDSIYLYEDVTVAYLEAREDSISNVVSEKFVNDSLLLFNYLVDKNLEYLSKKELKNLLTIHSYAYYSTLRSNNKYTKTVKEKLKEIFNKIESR